MTALLTRSPTVGSNQLEMLNPFCCPGVGARNPVLTLPRRNLNRPDTLPFVVVPKSSKFSTRTAVPSVQSLSMPDTSRSP